MAVKQAAKRRKFVGHRHAEQHQCRSQIGNGMQPFMQKHEAEDRALFAEGALAAAEFIVRQPAGLYAMQDLIDARATTK